MNPEDNKPLTEAELQIQRLLGLKKEKEEKIKTASEETDESGFEVKAAQAKTVKTVVKAVKKPKNTVKIDGRAYRRLNDAAKRLNMSVSGKKVSRDKLASMVIERVLSDESVLNGAVSKEVLLDRIKKLKITETADE